MRWSGFAQSLGRKRDRLDTSINEEATTSTTLEMRLVSHT